jgi:hypothetical protein
MSSRDVIMKSSGSGVCMPDDDCKSTKMTLVWSDWPLHRRLGRESRFWGAEPGGTFVDDPRGDSFR